MVAEEQDAIRENRIHFLDNLRTFMVFLVVLYHCGLVYESSGVAGFFWIVYDFSTNDLSSFPNLMIIDIFVMSMIFFISGFLAPLSLKNKSGWAFLKSKFRRLMIPWMIAVVTLVPLYKVIFRYSRGLPQHSWTTYFHWSNGGFGQSWLWFLPVLFLFDLLYLLFSKADVKLPNIGLKRAIGIVFPIGYVYSLCMDIFGAQGWTKTVLIDFQNERLLIYFMMFLLGSLCYKRKTFELGWKSKRLYLMTVCTAWIPVILYRSLFTNSFTKPGHFVFSEMADKLLIWLSFHVLLLCLLYLLIGTFRYYLDKQGKLSRELNRNSYSVYIIHTIVLGGIALTMLNTAIPSLLRFLILTVSTYTASNLLIYLYRRVIGSNVFVRRARYNNA